MFAFPETADQSREPVDRRCRRSSAGRTRADKTHLAFGMTRT